MDLTNLPANCVVLNDGAGDGPAKGKASATQPEEEDGVPVPERRLFREERLQLRWKKVVPVGAGLKNLGNTCFLNAVYGTILYLTRHTTLPACSLVLLGSYCSPGANCAMGFAVAGPAPR